MLLSPRLIAAVLALVAPACWAQSSPAGLADSGPQSAPWAARARPEVKQEEKTFLSGGATLSGTLFMPVQGVASSAIVVAHGASSPLRTSPLYHHLTTMLPPLGIAVFVYDRRGSGKSGGNIESSDYPALADDMIAAVHMLAGDPRIDKRRIGTWGLSQGGWLSLLASGRSRDVAFAVSISAPLVTPDVQMMFSSTNTLLVNGYSQEDIAQMRATRKAVDDYMRGTGDRETAQRLTDAAKSKPWFKYLYMGKTVGDRATSRWREEIEHDPLAALQTVRAPALILYGAKDPVVPVEISVQTLSKLTTGHPNLKVAVIDGADHGMQTSVSAKDLLDPAQADAERPDSAAYFGTLASWLTSIGMARLPRN